MKIYRVISLTLILFLGVLFVGFEANIAHSINNEQSKHFEETNEKILNYIIENKTTQGVEEYINDEIIEYTKEYTPQALRKTSSPAEKIEQIVIDDAYSNIHVYSDGTFRICSIQFYNTKDNTIIEPTYNTKTYTWDITDFNVGDNIHVHGYCTVFAPLPVSSWKLNTYMDVNVFTLDITSVNTQGSWAIWPRRVTSHYADIITDNSIVIETVGTYNYLLDEIYSSTEYIEMEVDYTDYQVLKVTQTCIH